MPDRPLPAPAIRPLLLRPAPLQAGPRSAPAAASGFRQMLSGALPTRPAAVTSTSLPGGLGPLVAQAARRHGVDPALVAAVIEVESGFDPNAESAAGAKGLMQLMDATARGLGVTDPYDPVQNVDGGTRLLRQLLDRHGDVRLALAAYNAGSGAVARYGGIPPYPETQRFVPLVLRAAERFRAAPSAPAGARLP